MFTGCSIRSSPPSYSRSPLLLPLSSLRTTKPSLPSRPLAVSAPPATSGINFRLTAMSDGSTTPNTGSFGHSSQQDTFTFHSVSSNNTDDDDDDDDGSPPPPVATAETKLTPSTRRSYSSLQPNSVMLLYTEANSSSHNAL